MADQATATTEPQTSFEEEQLEDDALLVALNEWATADAKVGTEKETAKPYKKAVTDAEEGRDNAAVVVTARLQQMEIEIVGTENVYRCGTYRLGNKHKPAGEREFEIPAKDTLKIERAE